MFTATLIAADRMSAGDISSACDIIRSRGAAVKNSDWIDEGKAADISFIGDAPKVRAALEHSIIDVDVIVQKTDERRRKLLIADMDSTMITVECIDELADYAGIKDEIAAVTERAMRGELDFEEALRSRVALLKGLDQKAIDDCLTERVKIMPGAHALVRTVRAKGGIAILISGGFTRFADPVGAEIGFDRIIANVLGIEKGRLSGVVDGPIVNSATKKETLEGAMTATGWPVANTIAVGDGANDIPMIQTAGLGVAYYAKPKTAEAASARIDHGDLSAILYGMGYPQSEWAVA
jgi:phosphoserine phosphatase